MNDAEQQMILGVLQRSDPSITRVLLQSKHVTLYSFSRATNSWSREDVEGGMYVVARSTAPDLQLVCFLPKFSFSPLFCMAVEKGISYLQSLSILFCSRLS